MQLTLCLIQGSDKIRGIMWCEPEPITVSLKASVFKKMENLKFLIVKNVQNSKKLKYLSNELRLFEWSEYNFILPSEFSPKNLVGLKVSCIRSAKLFKQVWVYYLWIFISLNVIFKIRWNDFFFLVFFFFFRGAITNIWKVSVWKGVNPSQDYLTYALQT